MNVRKQGEEVRLVAGAFGKESKLTAEGSRFRFQRALLIIISAWPFSLLSPVEGGEMSGAKAAGGGGVGRPGMAPASSFGSRRYQAGDYFSQREARRDSGESDSWDQAESEGQARSSEEWQPPHLGAYVVIPPNPTRREQLQKIANKELEDLAKWKDQHKPGPITLLPQKLGKQISGDTKSTDA